MKLIIQIPCYNEEKTLPIAIKNLPKKIKGIAKIEILIINDGSMDKTIEVAKKLGIRHIVNFKKNQGLAKAFSAGLDKALELGADIIVNTDGDNQYPGEKIPELIAPILNGKADICIGCRKIQNIKEFSLIKKILQKIGSTMVSKISGTKIPDTTSGFRAYSREAAMRLNVVSEYTYTLETILQAGYQNMAMTYILVDSNKKIRDSRLMTNVFSYLRKSIITLLRIYTFYEPLKTFTYAASVFFLAGLILLVRYFYYYFFAHQSSGHLQSLIVSTILITIGIQVFLIGLVADMIAANRKMFEEIKYKIKKNNLK